MHDMYRIKPLKTLAWWIAVTVFIFPVSAVALAITGFPAIYIIDGIARATGDYRLIEMTALFIGIPLAGAVIATVMAFLQRRVLRKNLYWVADKWTLWTIIGGITGAILSATGNYLFQDSFFYGDGFFFMMPLFLLGVSAFQWIALREAVQQAWLWIVANLIAGIVFAGVIVNNEPSYYDPNYELLSFAQGILSVVAIGVITGFVILFLFEKKLLPMYPDTTQNNP